MAAGPKIAIIYYSKYGHIRTMANAVKHGIESAGGEATLFKVPEIQSAEVLQAEPDHEVLIMTRDKLEDLLAFDGLLFGVPTRFGMMPAEMKAFFDSTGQMWSKGQLVGKPAGVFFSTASQNGGQETTAMTTITQFVHHGMIFVPIGYKYGADMFLLQEPHGGSPWGSGTLAGNDGSRQPSKYELGLAHHQGNYFTKVVRKLKSPVQSTMASD